MPFLSAWGCCSVCRRVVSCRASTLAQAPGTRPYRHKAKKGTDEPWCEGAFEPALHFTRSTDTKAVEEIKLVKWQAATYRANRKDKKHGN